MSLISPLMPVPQSYHYFCYIALPLSTMYAVDSLYFCTPTAQLKQLSMGLYKIYLVSTSEWWTRNFMDRRGSYLAHHR